jgi:hypothetical protein
MSLHHALDSIKHSHSQMIYSTRWSPPATASSSLRHPRISRVLALRQTSNCPKRGKSAKILITMIAAGRRNAPPSFMSARQRLGLPLSKCQSRSSFDM